MEIMSAPVLTIGHSAHSPERFVALLQEAGATAVADVRSMPWSRRHPQFGRERLSATLRGAGIAYVFLGKELGGRPHSREFYRDGVADYEKMARTESFQRGLDRVLAGAARYHIALMCAEHDPLDCHRCLLVARALAERGVGIGHVMGDGTVSAHATIEDRLLALAGSDAADLFAPRAEQLAAAYRARARRFAFRDPPATSDG
jgi:uncharacterized protein (DUF488 family)